MSWMDQIGNVLQQYTGGGAQQPSPDVHDHFDQVAQAAPASSMADGLAAAFGSDRTPAFGQMVSQLFSQSNGQQRAGLLNRLMGTMGPGVLGQIPALAGILGGGRQITPEQAQKVPPEAVQQIAAQAEKKDPSIIHNISDFYAQHPDVIKALGGMALAIAIGKIAQRQSS